MSRDLALSVYVAKYVCGGRGVLHQVAKTDASFCSTWAPTRKERAALQQRR